MAKLNKNQENDILSRAGTKVVESSKRKSRVRAEKFKEEGMKTAVMDFIFGGDSEAVSPLAS